MVVMGEVEELPLSISLPCDPGKRVDQMPIEMERVNLHVFPKIPTHNE